MTSKSGFQVRDATPADGDAMLALFPRLADFEVPPKRKPEDLWREDARLLKRWIAGEVNCVVQVATNFDGQVLGVTLSRIRPEPLGQMPSAHLEVIAVSKEAEGQGVARALLDSLENTVRALGAKCITLHVIASNERARRFYDQAGFDGELLRYIKHLDD